MTNGTELRITQNASAVYVNGLVEKRKLTEKENTEAYYWFTNTL